MSAHQQIALITGASSGIGALYADRFAQRGYDLILVARNAARLRSTAERIRKALGRSVRTCSADLTSLAGQHRVVAMFSANEQIKVLVNNAGIGATQSLLESDADKMGRMIELNVRAASRIALAAAKEFSSRGEGAIINIASVAALAPEVLNGVYSATKSFVLTLSRSLHHEFASKGVRIQVVLPGATATDFWEVAGGSVDSLPSEIVMPADVMVDAALAGFDAGEFATIPSLEDASAWSRYEAAREALLPGLSRSKPASRYTDRKGPASLPASEDADQRGLAQTL